MLRFLTLFLTLFTSFFLIPVRAQEKTIQTLTTFPFVASYAQWIDPNNHFIDYFNDQARVIFCGSAAYSVDGDGIRPTVSEGMGYGLLLSYAYNDQATFDKFLRYVIAVSNTEGCSTFNGVECLAPCPFLMPWVVNNLGQPFWYLPNPSTQVSYYSSGSATDSDIQIAWAIYLANQRVSNGSWTNSTFSTVKGSMTYLQLFEEMALQIRLNDVDLETLRYNPGNQWGAAGKEVLYPGYFTPQAFLALDTVPPPNVSTNCPDSYPAHSPENSLLLVFKNNVVKTISIDYLGGNGTVSVDSNFVPKPGVPNGYTVSALTEATATFSSPNQYYANATIQATFYDEQGVGIYKSNYYIEYNNNNWTVTDQGSTSESSYCQSETASCNGGTVIYKGGNVVYIFLTQPDIEKVTFKFERVMGRSLKSIKNFNRNYQTGLFPNVIHFDQNYPDLWSKSFAYDACRFALWSGSFLQANPQHFKYNAIKKSVDSLLSSKGVADFIQNQTLPSDGINALTQEPLGNWDAPAYPLNATVMTAAWIVNNLDIYNKLSPPVLNYPITTAANQPLSTDPVGDSGPYYNAAMVLMSRAILEQRL